MHTKTKLRGERRANRQRAITHAFNLYWYEQWNRDPFAVTSWLHDGVVHLETNAERYERQDEYRNEVLESAKRTADHLRQCSCFICSGYKKYEKAPSRLREEYRNEDAALELRDWENHQSHRWV